MTTEAEIESFNIIRGMLADTVPIEDIKYKDTESYFGILYKNNKGKDAKNDNEAISDFVDGLYNDFKRFDLPDYEVCFLQCVHCMILNKKLSQLVLSNFELVP